MLTWVCTNMPVPEYNTKSSSKFPPKVKIPTRTIYSGQKIGPLPIKTHPYRLVLRILQVPTTQLAKMSIDPKFVGLTADVLKIFFVKYEI